MYYLWCGDKNLLTETHDGDSPPKSRSPQGKPLNVRVKTWLLVTGEVRAGLRLGSHEEVVMVNVKLKGMNISQCAMCI